MLMTKMLFHFPTLPQYRLPTIVKQGITVRDQEHHDAHAHRTEQVGWAAATLLPVQKPWRALTAMTESLDGAGLQDGQVLLSSVPEDRMALQKGGALRHVPPATSPAHVPALITQRLVERRPGRADPRRSQRQTKTAHALYTRLRQMKYALLGVYLLRFHSLSVRTEQRAPVATQIELDVPEVSQRRDIASR
jgi:hypothetical protein